MKISDKLKQLRESEEKNRKRISEYAKAKRKSLKRKKFRKK